jgi:hypothetical protein
LRKIGRKECEKNCRQDRTETKKWKKWKLDKKDDADKNENIEINCTSFNRIITRE